ncbi:MAG TPA: hypothetical protein VEK57_11725 [Thermoanaerobaculia bacterium]|nr:hypothetical protein [Thermoanaerobaculia bacterium]
MNFDLATIQFPDGRVAQVTPTEFYAIPLGERIELLTSSRIKFHDKDKQLISPLLALKKKT